MRLILLSEKCMLKRKIQEKIVDYLENGSNKTLALNVALR